ncbi:hypothetical protein [Hymenobacter negativus]|uniref:Uncharacterized protein n=1 Tax=Hymenobacter negativus TaxID=2795026 RepID=A0ABS3QIH4_9BACT|nr:hypothetical protein [Hymenobacter negativus]MBO2010808.1 hypothetical protein [Hymenobacter negativus]
MNRPLLFGPLLLLLLTSTVARAQVGVGTTTPNAKAALDIQAADKGLLIPRLTAAQRSAIGSPPRGLMVYQTDAPEGFYYFGGSPGTWVYLDPNPAGGTLTLPYFSTVSGANEVGFWVNASGATATGLRGSGTTSGTGVFGTTSSGIGVWGLSVGAGGGTGVFGSTAAADESKAGVVGQNTNVTSDQAIGVLGKTAAGVGVLGTATSGTGLGGLSDSFYGVSGQSSSGVGVYGASNSDVGILGESGSGTGVRGVGNSSALLEAGVIGDNTNNAGTGVMGRTETGQGVRGLAFGAGGRGVYGAASSTNGVGVEAEASATGGTAVRAVGTNGARALSAQANTSSAAAVVTQNGSGPTLVLTGGSGVGIGSLVPLTRLSISPVTTEAKITLYDANSGTDHYGFGVSSAQLNYHVAAATDNHVFYAGGKNGNGAELMRIKGNGRVGIGTNNPQALLDVGGTMRAVEVNTPTTGAANLLPVAYGRIQANGSVASGTGNFTCSQTNGLYTVTFTAASGLNTTSFGSATIMATPNGSNAPIFGFAGSAGQVQFIFDPAGAQDAFSFMVYRP